MWFDVDGTIYVSMPGVLWNEGHDAESSGSEN